MNLPKTTPTEFCRAYIERDLQNFIENNKYKDRQKVMKQMLLRSDELSIMFRELVDAFGYSDKMDSPHLWLTFEHIWDSYELAQESIVASREMLKSIKKNTKDIIELAQKLSQALREQEELYRSSGFCKQEYQSVFDMIEQGGKDNGYYEFALSEKLRSLDGQFDLKYWPKRADIVESIALFESNLQEPEHSIIPDVVMKGRVSNIKDFVLAFDSAFDELNDLPDGFRFSNNALAEIINVVLDVQVDKLVTADAIRLVRNRY
ncbi:hypothetical protein [Photobacterium lucens]|uniref:hypothetical protein n=1 Tax=Photobacterium lucens TaxID=2562949 RepID=UPI00136D9359|nr:hypothetical protein [Photobacterium lucens]MBP2699504.1 hypothetical protein [Vibrio parahaemolyticus]MZG56983.1 hypothetical protein [Photobacterium lucens]MZG80422.1 hypothetical protein [Photobacterium lucens]